MSTLENRKKKVVGEPDEGKPHVRFDVAGDENQDRVIAINFHLRPRRHLLTLPAAPPRYRSSASVLAVVICVGGRRLTSGRRALARTIQRGGLTSRRILNDFCSSTLCRYRWYKSYH